MNHTMNAVQLFMFRLSGVAVLLSGWAFATPAQAHFGNAGDCSPQANPNVSIAPITLPGHVQVGQALGAVNGYDFDSGNGFVMGCRYKDWPIEQRVTANISIVNSTATGMTFSASGLSMPVYATSLPGVGFAVMARDPGQPFHPLDHGATALLTVKHNKPNGWGLQGRIYLVATGPVSAGTITAHTFANYTLTNVTTSGPGYVSVSLSNAVIAPPLRPTCHVSTPSVAMPMGPVAGRDFKGVGSYAARVSQNIRLNCAGGTGGSLDIWVTVSDQTNPANRSSQLSLTRTSTAKGVAIQLLSGPSVLSYGADSASVGNLNQWRVTSTSNGTITIPLTARYVQTEKMIKPGTANGLASFTMSYR